jgi:hypothetical protein
MSTHGQCTRPKAGVAVLQARIPNCCAACERLRALGVVFALEPVERYGNVNAGFRAPSGNGWKLIEACR